MLRLITDYHWQWTFILAVSVLFFCWQWVMPRFGISASLLLACCAYSSIWVWVVKDNRYLPINPYDQMALRYFACDSIAKIMLILVPMMLFSERKDTMLFTGTALSAGFVIANSLASIWEARHGCGDNKCGGLVGNPSISMGFMACLLPIFIRSWKRQGLLLIPVLMAIYFSQSSVAAGLLAAYACLHFLPALLERKNILRYIAQAGVICSGVLGVFAYGTSKGLLHDSDRFMIWQYMFDRWRAPWNIAFGTGLGTYHVFSINLQNFKDSSGHLIHQIAGQMWWNTLHNDPLQMLFECGVIGLLFLLFTYCTALLKTYREKDWPILSSVILYGIYMALDPALHNPLPVLFGAWLFTYALRRNNFDQKLTLKENL